MFDISFAEMIIIFIVALIVIGPERLPRVARTMGHLLGRARRYVDNVKSDIQHEIELDELKRLKNSVQETTHSIEQSLKQEFDQIQTTTDMNTVEKTKNPVLAELRQINTSVGNKLPDQRVTTQQQVPESDKSVS
ncbi:Sec-independent protein translocase protein TatB [Nitrosomonas communis]|uniref:Sec-independent protein translocase protein TatB n=1 Tax=Nitrosomonas communis TaxID=44574 RepID=UPI0026E99344|nr:Sec-independent protein translocase protein TatB [Nitrosomonas communis]MCO6427042.1 twin-arginine translocase subunit TatB [Nitrosomonas communis]